jgi:hypothetical protein
MRAVEESLGDEAMDFNAREILRGARACCAKTEQKKQRSTAKTWPTPHAFFIGG